MITPSLFTQRLIANIRWHMQELEMNQEDLAGALGCTQGYVSQLLSGRTSPKLDTIGKIAAALNCDISDLLAE